MRRRILFLSVGMTTLVVLAFAIPLVLLLRSTTASEAKDKARNRAETVAYYVGDKDHTADDITAYINGLPDGPGTISVRMADGTTLGNPPPGGIPAPNDVPAGDDDGDGRRGPPKLGNAQYRDVPGGLAVDVAVGTPNGTASVCLYLTEDELYAGLTPRLLILVGGSLAVLLLSIVGAELVSRRLARPLEETAGTAERLARDYPDPGNSRTYAQYLIQAGRRQDARDVLEALRTSDPADFDTVRMLGDLRTEMGDVSGALDCMLAAAAAFDAALFAAERSIQIHGGIGFTWEHPAHLLLRRARANAVAVGRPEVLRDGAVLKLLAGRC